MSQNLQRILKIDEYSRKFQDTLDLCRENSRIFQNILKSRNYRIFHKTQNYFEIFQNILKHSGIISKLSATFGSISKEFFTKF